MYLETFSLITHSLLSQIFYFTFDILFSSATFFIVIYYLLLYIIDNKKE